MAVKGVVYCSILFRRSIYYWRIKFNDELQSFQL